MGQQVVLTPQAIEQIRQQTKQEWRKCKRKQYNIFACKMPAGYIFANKLEQPNSYNAIKQVFHKDIVHSSEFKNNPQLVEFLKANGFYQTDGTRIVLCGTKGELWDVKPEKFVQSYRAITGGQITSMEDGIWIEVTRAPEMKANAVGIQLPKKYLGVYKTSWATLYVNNPNSSGHGKGDILVAPMLPNGQPDYAHISPTNNEVFALTYDQNVGSWGNSGLIINANNIKRLTLSEVRSMYKVASSESNYDNIVNLAVNACKGFVMQTIKEDNGVDTWIFDPRIGSSFNVYSQGNKVGIVAQAESYNDKSKQWCSTSVSIENKDSVKSIIDEYNNHAKEIAVKFKQYCDKFKLNLLYDLSKKRRKNGTCFVNKAKLNFMIRVICKLAEVYHWSDFKITDYRIQDELDLTENYEPKIHIEFTYAEVCAVLVTSCDFDNNDFEFYGWGEANMGDDPYEIDIFSSESCFLEVRKALNIIRGRE